MAFFVGRGKSKGAGTGPLLVPGLDVRAGSMVAARYRIEELVGSGPSGVVLSAMHVHMRQPAILKILASYTDTQSDLLDRRVQKARRAARLVGRHVARVLDIGLTEAGMPYVATERVAGVTMETELAERGRLPAAEAVRRALEVCEALAEAHALGLVHGDLKPQNLFLADAPANDVEREDEGDAARDRRVLKVLDFGSTSPLEAIGDQSTSAFFGSPAFLAPEQIQDATKVDARADVWAVGALLHTLISGKPPFEADSLSGVLVAVVYDRPAFLVEAPLELATVVARCLEKDPAHRPADISELADALAPFAGAEGAELAENVRLVLDTPPPMSKKTAKRVAKIEAEGNASDSIAPISVDLARRAGGASERPTKPAARASTTPTRDVREKKAAAGKSKDPKPVRQPWDVPTQASRAVQRRRAQRSHAAAFASIGAAAAIALAAFATDRPREAEAAESAPATAIVATYAEPVVPPFLPPTDIRNLYEEATPVVAPLPVTTPSALPDAPPVSSSTSSSSSSSSSSQSSPASPNAPQGPQATTPAQPRAVLPRSVPLASKTPEPPMRLPSELPSSRSGIESASASASKAKLANGRTPPPAPASSPSVRSTNATSTTTTTTRPAADRRRDDTYVRNIMTGEFTTRR